MFSKRQREEEQTREQMFSLKEEQMFFVKRTKQIREQMFLLNKRTNKRTNVLC